MSDTDTDEILNWTSEQNLLHMRQGEEIDYLFEWLFKYTEILVDGTTKVQVESMSQFKKIELLERLWDDPKMAGDEMVGHIGRFVQEIKPYKDGFRTVDDYEQAAQ